jgi:hypothetical protein
MKEAKSKKIQQKKTTAAALEENGRPTEEILCVFL